MKKNKPVLGTKVELKNINSFKAVKNAIAYELGRQKEVLDSGGKVVQETRGWDEKKRVTSVMNNAGVQPGRGNIGVMFLSQQDISDEPRAVSHADAKTGAIYSHVDVKVGATYEQRIKEEANDYRYMPEPDLPSVELGNADSGIDTEAIKLSVPELPQAKRERFVKEFGLREDQIEVLVGDRYVAEYFEEASSELSTMEKQTDKSVQLLVNYLTSDVVGLLNSAGQKVKDLKISPENFAELTILIEKGEISSRVAKDVLREMFKTGADPSNIIEEKDLGQISDEGEITDVVEEVIKENEKAVADYKKGKETVIKFLVGQAMAKLRGRGDPSRLEELLKDNLK